MKPFSTAAEKLEREENIRLLRETPANLISESGHAATIEAFQRTAASVPFYRHLLESKGLDPARITTMDAFRAHVPILDKGSTFGAHSISELCVAGTLEGVRSVLTSSGFMSGVFSFGVNTADNLSRSAKSIDLGLQYLFDIDEKSTLLINCLPMGVKVNTRATVLAETSVREDMVFAVVKKFAPEFDQIILVGEGSFIKKIIEDGAELHEIDWRALRVHVVTGEEGIAENYRTYIGSELGVDDFDAPDSRIIGSSMGVAELDLNIFHETRETIRIRRLAHGDAELRRRLFGTAVPWCPMLFVYYPHRCYVEELAIESGHSELLMSMLSEEMKIPLLRYRSGDHGRVIPYAEMVDLLKGCGYPIEPDLRLPFVAVSGRDRAVNTPSGKLFPEAVKEALYQHHAIARAITGNFRITGQEGGELHIQLRRDKLAPPDAEALLLDALAPYSSVKPAVRFYTMEGFPYNMSIDFERKFAYIG